MLKNLKNYILFVLLWGFSATLFCQEKLTNNVDSLISNSKNVHIPDSIRIESSYRLALVYIYKNSDSAAYFVNIGLQVSEESKNIDGMGEGYAWMAYLNEDKGNIKEAIDYNLKSLAIVQSQNLVTEYPVILNNLGTLHLKLKNNTKALHYFEECIQINKDLGKQSSLATNYYNIGIIYSNQLEYEKAKEYYLKSTELRLEIGDEIGLGNSYSGLGTNYEKIDSLDIALAYYEKGLALREKNQINKGISLSLLDIGNIYYKKGDYKTSLNYAFSSYEIAKKWGYRHNIKESAKLLYKNLKKQNRFKDALLYHEEYKALHDSIHNLENQDALIRSEYEFDYIKKHLIDSLEQDKILIKNKLLKDENELKEKKIAVQRLWLTVSLLGVLLLLIMLFFIRKTSSIRMEKLRTEIKLRHVETLSLKDELSAKSELSTIQSQGLNVVLHDKLTTREQEILDALVLGLSNRQIGEKLFLSVNTIKTHINNLYVKLDVSNRTQAAVKGSLLKLQEKS